MIAIINNEPGRDFGESNCAARLLVTIKNSSFVSSLFAVVKKWDFFFVKSATTFKDSCNCCVNVSCIFVSSGAETTWNLMYLCVCVIWAGDEKKTLNLAGIYITGWTLPASCASPTTAIQRCILNPQDNQDNQDSHLHLKKNAKTQKADGDERAKV